MGADVLDVGGLGGDLDHPQQVARVDRPAQLGREHQAAVLPLIARAEALGGSDGRSCFRLPSVAPVSTVN